MSKKLVCIIIFIVVVIVVGLFFENHVSYEKVIKESDIPKAVLEKLNNTNLERGVYVFTRNFVDGYVYLVFCGGEHYKNNYDVTVKKLSKKNNFHTFHNVLIKESDSQKKVEYGTNYKYPIVVYRVKDYTGISEKSLMFEVSVATNNGDKVPIINWWGSSRRDLSKKQFSYEFINNKKDIPDVILDKLNYYEFKDVPAAYVFSPSDTAVTSFDIDDLYLIISPGKKNVDRYSVLIENIYLPNRSNNNHALVFYISLREQYDTDYGHFTNFQGYPYEVLKISSSLIKNRIRRVNGKTYSIRVAVGSTYYIENDTSYLNIPIIEMRTDKE
ncbi:hypothetical protein IMX26_14565 [Clostridium sp. 'deep sea']|uniref:hypothetical protein n=1 Tax=Clostridium sp. 'deep sea' TaxID=2779445 RepID=UPI0018968465|nr:hypothetical protein [Clostridium sp. 'deep sea']QOR34678.1 hypothetical protein IMX26_14565 [Clostridium sp. 'deep sea']